MDMVARIHRSAQWTIAFRHAVGGATIKLDTDHIKIPFGIEDDGQDQREMISFDVALRHMEQIILGPPFQIVAVLAVGWRYLAYRPLVLQWHQHQFMRGLDPCLVTDQAKCRAGRHEQTEAQSIMSIDIAGRTVSTALLVNWMSIDVCPPDLQFFTVLAPG